MALSEWKVPKGAQPRPGDYGFDLDRRLSGVLALSTVVPGDAFTAETLGTERAGNGVLIDASGLVLTIGYLITEATQVWLTTNDGRVLPGDVVGYDAETGFGLVQALARVDLPAIPLGSSEDAAVGDDVIIAGAGGRARSVAARIVARQEFAGYWEYLLEEALFVSPPHPHWGGTALLDQSGRLIGIGSLQLQQDRERDRSENLNMVVPIDLLKPILKPLQTSGASGKPPRPWLGLFATEVDSHVVVAGLSDKGPADTAGLQVGDLIVAVAGSSVDDLAGFYRRIWSAGPAGTALPLRIGRSGRSFDVIIQSTDRGKLLRKPVVH